MREIKFRGKDIDSNEWVTGFYIESSNEHHLGQRSLIVCGDSSVRYAGREFIEVDPDTVSEFTGLKDKNGKEIYEGDIVEINHEGKSTIGFQDGAFTVENLEGKGILHLAYPLCKIIGNIYENPELLS